MYQKELTFILESEEPIEDEDVASWAQWIAQNKAPEAVALSVKSSNVDWRWLVRVEQYNGNCVAWFIVNAQQFRLHTVFRDENGVLPVGAKETCEFMAKMFVKSLKRLGAPPPKDGWPEDASKD